MSVEMTGIKHRTDHETYENSGFEHVDTETVTDILDEELKIKEIAVEEEMQAYQKVILSIQESVGTSYKRHSKIIWTTIYILLLLAYCAYLSYALYFRFGDEGSWRLLGFSVFGIALIVVMKVYRHYESDVLRWLARKKGYMDNNCTRIFGTVIAWVLRLGVLIFLIVYIVIDVALDQPQNLVCVAGLLIYILLFFITSANPAKTVTDILDEELKIKEIAVEEEMQAYQKVILSIQESVGTSYKRHSKIIWTTIYILLLLAYCAYLSYALYFRFGDEGSWRLLGFSVFGIALIVVMKVYRHYESDVHRWLARKKGYMDNNCTRIFGTVIAWVLRLGVLIFLIVYIVIDVALDQPQNLVCVAGLLIYILLFFITSANPAKVNWHAVFWGIALQYIFALMILRTVWGYNIFKWLGDRATEFLEYVVAGAEFVFGQSYEDHYFAMKVLSTIIFFFSFINILYYLGVMQAIIKVLGRFLAFCLGTTAAESINAAANIFVDMQGACLIVRPYLKTMTRSELHAVMTGGFSTIAGSVLGAYISFGVPANHLLSASVMSAPAALALSKLSYPETERRKDADDFSRLESSNERNLIDAASNGALASLKIVGAIAANVIAFMSMLAFINATLTWFGDRVGVENLTFELITSYVFYPVAFFMGIETSDCRKVAELIGVKTFTNEFVAYSRLKDLIANRHSLENYTSVYNTSDWYWNDDNVVFNITGEVLKGGVITIKSEVIVTYALCGFANLSAIGSQLGALTALAPTRRADLVQIVFRAMVCGNVACFLTACIAGLLYKEF